MPSATASGITIQRRILPRGHEPEALHRNRFLKKTARGKVISVTRERYLRDDIGCARATCPLCHVAVPRAGAEGRRRHAPQLDARGNLNAKLPTRHYIVLDTNVVLHQMDLLESMLGPPADPSNATSSAKPLPVPTFVNVIVLQTVLDEVRHRSLPLYNRLQALVQESDRHWAIFWNETHRETATFREDGETPNDHNDRAIRKAVAWYSAHFRSTVSTRSPPLEAVLLSDDVANVAKARRQEISAISVRDYVSGMPRADELMDLLSSRSLEGVTEDGTGTAKTAFYPAYVSPGQLKAAVASGAAYSGFFNASPFNYLEATVRAQGHDRPILLVGREAMNRAVDGDVVAVELLPESEWKHETNEVLDASNLLRNDDAGDGDDDDDEGEADKLGDGDEEARMARREERDAAALAKARSDQAGSRKPQPTGKIIGIVRRNWRSYVCTIDASSVSSSALSNLGASTVFATPIDRKIPRIRMRTRQAATLLGQKILVALDDWRETSRYPDGHFVRALGQAESVEAEQESLLLEQDVPYRPFSRAILDCLPVEGDAWKVPPKDQAGPAWRDRVDLRKEIICSIDPPGCQDIDDALHAKRLPNGNIEAGVHIADVSYFVRPDTLMDTEAASRSTTVYLVDKRIDMLPHLLGTNLCSLRPHVERLAFSVLWEMTPDAEVVGARFFKSVIASKAAFTYEEAQLRKDDAKQTDDITKSIRLLHHLAVRLKRKRMEAGALNLASPEVRIQLDSSESTAPIDVEQKEMRETNSLVEEFMLLANVSVAEKIQENFPLTAVLRRHMPPPATNFETLNDILQKRKGFALDTSSSGALADSLDKCVDNSLPEFNTLVRIMATRCMLAAEYVSAGSGGSFAHYGLAIGNAKSTQRFYTHFTSPIRRYPDVLAHRMLATAIDYEILHPSLRDRDHVDRMLNNANKRHRNAQMAGRSSVAFYVGLSIAKRNKDTGTNLREKAFVIRTFRNGLAVYVSQYGLEGLITFAKDCEYDAERYEVRIPAPVSGLARDVKLGIFDQCDVEIGVEKDKATGRGNVAMRLV